MRSSTPLAAHSTSSWSDLETRGFVVVPSFLSHEDMSVLCDDFAKGAPPASYPHGFKLVGRRALDAMASRLAPTLGEIRAHTSLQVDLVTFLTFSHYIVTELTERTSFWHQDFDFDYRLTRDHIDYLNFWIAIDKPDASRSNVRVIPFDALNARSTQAFDLLRGSGGHRFVPKDGKTLVFGSYGKILDATVDAEQPEHVLDFNLDELAVTPDLAAGDLLLMRGDIIHKTQDAATKRIAASIRATSSKKMIRKEHVDATNADKPRDPVSQLNASILQCFDKLGADSEITIGQYVSFASGGRGVST